MLLKTILYVARALTISRASSSEAANLKEDGGRGKLESTKPTTEVTDKRIIRHFFCPKISWKSVVNIKVE